MILICCIALVVVISMTMSIRVRSLVQQRYENSSTSQFRDSGVIAPASWVNMRFCDMFPGTDIANITKVGDQIKMNTPSSNLGGMIFQCGAEMIPVESENGLDSRVTLDIEATVYNAIIGFASDIGIVSTQMGAVNAFYLNTNLNKLMSVTSSVGQNAYTFYHPTWGSASYVTKDLELTYAKNQTNRYTLVLLNNKASAEKVRMALYINGQLMHRQFLVSSDPDFDLFGKGLAIYMLVVKDWSSYILIESMRFSR